MTPSQILPYEYNPFYKGYLDLVDAISLSESLNSGLQNSITFFHSIPKEKLDYQYAQGKWTPKDILQHISDTERVFAYRALYFARNNDAVLEGFEENIFAENAQAVNKTLTQLLDEYITVRNASISLFQSFNYNQLEAIGIANGNRMSVRAAGFIICGHAIHHSKIIKERYL